MTSRLCISLMKMVMKSKGNKPNRAYIFKCFNYFNYFFVPQFK